MRGVSLRGDRYCGQISIGGRLAYLGMFATAELASNAVEHAKQDSVAQRPALREGFVWVRVHVNREVIADGVRDDSMLSPPALAIDRITRRGYAVVSTTRAVLEENAIVKECLWMSEDLRAWMHRFDGGKKVEPFSFEIDLPQERLRVSGKEMR